MNSLAFLCLASSSSAFANRAVLPLYNRYVDFRARRGFDESFDSIIEGDEALVDCWVALFDEDLRSTPDV